VSNPIISYYTRDYVEADRLKRSAAGRLEFMRTQELLRRHLPTGGSVADIGGGTGAHAAWLLEDGYEVQLIDLTPAHVEIASGSMPKLQAQVGDARNLPLADRSVEATLLLGPLYHLTRAQDRRQAIEEAVRVTRPGGLVAVAAISRYAPMLDLAVHGALTDDVLGMVRGQLETGRHDSRVGFTDAYMHTPEELAAELDAAGLTDVVVYGVEGPLWAAAQLVPAEHDLTQYLTVARELETDPSATAFSGHLLAVGRLTFNPHEEG